MQEREELNLVASRSESHLALGKDMCQRERERERERERVSVKNTHTHKHTHKHTLLCSVKTSLSLLSCLGLAVGSPADRSIRCRYATVPPRCPSPGPGSAPPRSAPHGQPPQCQPPQRGATALPPDAGLCCVSVMELWSRTELFSVRRER